MIEIIDSLEKETAVVFTGVRDMKLFKLQVDTSVDFPNLELFVFPKLCFFYVLK